jgi:hypothetical protein
LVGEKAIAYGGEIAYDIMHPMHNTGDQKALPLWPLRLLRHLYPHANALPTTNGPTVM